MYSKKDHGFALTWAKKIMAIEMLGGKCQICGEKDVFALAFHHKDKNEKDSNVNDIKDQRFSNIEKEIKKCILLCKNCHNELHYSGKIKNPMRRDIKKNLLDYKNEHSCKICGYNKCFSSLSFHHRSGSKKSFEIFAESWKYKGKCNVDALISGMSEELDKCDVLCCNCHNKKHSDTENFERLKDLIYKKLQEYREIPKSYVERVRELLRAGKRQVEICTELGCAKSTVCEIIKRHNLKNGV